MISFIVSAFDRPMHLRCCVYSLLAQSVKCQIIVVDNNPVYGTNKVDDPGVEYIHSGNPAIGCYDSAMLALPLCKGDFLCFPSDDSYYVPTFAVSMEWFAISKGLLDFVYCDMLYDQRLNRRHYSVLIVAPMHGFIDKTGFIVKRSRFSGFPVHVNDWRDGEFIEQMVAAGASHGKVPNVLVVHN